MVIANWLDENKPVTGGVAIKYFVGKNGKVAMNHWQLESQDLTDAFSVLNAMLGDRFLDRFVESTVEYQELTTDPEKDAMKKEAFEQWCAFLILYNSNQAKYGEVLHNLASQ